MIATVPQPAPPSDDKRWKIVGATIRRNGAQGHALIETLHSVQECFGYLDDAALAYVAGALNVPLSKVFGVATFYHFFTLKPQGEHTCVICLGTACYIKGAAKLVEKVEHELGVKPGQTTADNKVSVVSARCIGACGLAPAAVLDGQVVGNVKPETLTGKFQEWRR